ncbi:hypothetical protein BDV96DRAFT_641907 [Lophiotrema nucula]|uniref:Uncharacterized protein n=1 Tax=Lophiotrema nucula TaxID=690887 RepID=A0A6A5ZMI6_9PLEO|nr:hypothetical protein BDV96DRAFT_641907 [Lophiotrema nucula]
MDSDIAAVWISSAKHREPTARSEDWILDLILNNIIEVRRDVVIANIVDHPLLRMQVEANRRQSYENPMAPNRNPHALVSINNGFVNVNQPPRDPYQVPRQSRAHLAVQQSTQVGATARTFDPVRPNSLGMLQPAKTSTEVMSTEVTDIDTASSMIAVNQRRPASDLSRLAEAYPAETQQPTQHPTLSARSNSSNVGEMKCSKLLQGQRTALKPILPRLQVPPAGTQSPTQRFTLAATFKPSETSQIRGKEEDSQQRGGVPPSEHHHHASSPKFSSPQKKSTPQPYDSPYAPIGFSVSTPTNPPVTARFTPINAHTAPTKAIPGVRNAASLPSVLRDTQKDLQAYLYHSLRQTRHVFPYCTEMRESIEILSVGQHPGVVEARWSDASGKTTNLVPENTLGQEATKGSSNRVAPLHIPKEGGAQKDRNSSPSIIGIVEPRKHLVEGTAETSDHTESSSSNVNPIKVPHLPHPFPSKDAKGDDDQAHLHPPSPFSGNHGREEMGTRIKNLSIGDAKNHDENLPACSPKLASADLGSPPSLMPSSSSNKASASLVEQNIQPVRASKSIARPSLRSRSASTAGLTSATGRVTRGQGVKRTQEDELASSVKKRR